MEERGRQTEREIFHLFVHSPNGRNRLGRVESRLQPGAKITILVCHMLGSAAFPGRLAGSWIGSRGAVTPAGALKDERMQALLHRGVYCPVDECLTVSSSEAAESAMKSILGAWQNKPQKPVSSADFLLVTSYTPSVILLVTFNNYLYCVTKLSHSP